MIEYREFMSLTDDEIWFIMDDIFNLDMKVRIERDTNYNNIECVFIMKCEKDDSGYGIVDSITLTST